MPNVSLRCRDGGKRRLGTTYESLNDRSLNRSGVNRAQQKGYVWLESKATGLSVGYLSHNFEHKLSYF
jgi:hypothetical protein